MSSSGPPPAPAAYPIVWPRTGAVIPLTTFGGEYPDPLTSCPGFTAAAGVPLIAQFNVTSSATAWSLSQNGSPVPSCEVDGSNYSNPDTSPSPSNPGYTAQSLGRAILSGFRATLVIPKNPLVPGSTYTFSVTAGGTTAASTFTTVSVPGSPTAVTAHGGLASVLANWKPPASTGGVAITGYWVSVSPGGQQSRHGSGRHQRDRRGADCRRHLRRLRICHERRGQLPSSNRVSHDRLPSRVACRPQCTGRAGSRTADLGGPDQ